MEHVDIPDGEIHRPNNFTYATAAARNSAVITDASLVNRIALQSDNGSYWRLVSVSPAVWKYIGKRNESGQIKVSYGATLSLVNFTSGVAKTFDINAATPTVSPSPVTTYPFSSATQTYAALFDATRGAGPTGRLIENPVAGQFNHWIFTGTYANKAAAEQGSIKIRLRNLVTGFVMDENIYLANTLTADTFTASLYTISDSTSIPSPNGYIVDAITSFSDADLTVNISSIIRVSVPIDYLEI